MATNYLDRYNLQYTDTLLRQRTQISIESSAHYIIGEDPSTPNHANRIIWANAVFGDPEAMTKAMMGAAVQNPLIYENGNEVTDAQIDQVIAPLIDFFADAVASGAIKLSAPARFP
jgi:hypothetical protein